MESAKSKGESSESSDPKPPVPVVPASADDDDGGGTEKVRLSEMNSAQVEMMEKMIREQEEELNRREAKLVQWAEEMDITDKYIQEVEAAIAEGEEQMEDFKKSELKNHKLLKTKKEKVDEVKTWSRKVEEMVQVGDQLIDKYRETVKGINGTSSQQRLLKDEQDKFKDDPMGYLNEIGLLHLEDHVEKEAPPVGVGEEEANEDWILVKNGREVAANENPEAAAPPSSQPSVKKTSYICTFTVEGQDGEEEMQVIGVGETSATAFDDAIDKLEEAHMIPEEDEDKVTEKVDDATNSNNAE